MRALCTLLTGMALTACSGGETSDGGSSARSAGDTLVVGTGTDIGYLLSPIAQSEEDTALVAALSVPMFDIGFDCSLKKGPGLATSWEWNDDGTVLKIELRDDLTWEDGTPVTSEDVAFTYDVVADKAVASPRNGFLENLRPDARPKVIDATHIEWHFTHPYDRDTQVAHVSIGLLPKHRLAEADRGSLRSHELAKAPLSYGPFRFASREPNQSFTLEPNPNYSGPPEWRPNLARVVYRVIPEYSSRLIELEAGNIDLMEDIAIEDADRLRDSHPELELVRRGWRSQDYITWNLDNELFKDVRVRRALAMGTNVDAMIDRLLTSKKTGERYARPAVSPLTPALCGVHNDEITPYAHSVEKAKALLAEAGWRDTDGDGVVDRKGKKMSFTLSTNSGNKRRADASVMFQDQMKKIGVEVNLQQLEGNTFYENLRKREYDAGLAGWAAALFVDPSDSWVCETEGTPRSFNYANYCNPEVDALIERGLKTANPREAAAIWKEMQAKIYEEQPNLFLWWKDEIVAVHERFETANINLLSTQHDLHEWSVPPEKVKYRR